MFSPTGRLPFDVRGTSQESATFSPVQVIPLPSAFTTHDASSTPASRNACWTLAASVRPAPPVVAGGRVDNVTTPIPAGTTTRPRTITSRVRTSQSYARAGMFMIFAQVLDERPKGEPE
jgi:hypothetical protein